MSYNRMGSERGDRWRLALAIAATPGMAAAQAPAWFQPSGAEPPVRIAQQAPAAPRPAPAAPRTAVAPPEAMVRLSDLARLIDALTQNGLLTRDQGQALVSQAAAGASRAPRAGVAAVPVAPPVLGDPTVPVPGTLQVSIVPEGVRKRIREEVRGDVLAQARAEGWGAPGGGGAEWTQRIRLFGDLRVRGEAVTFPSGNAADFGFPNFQSINGGTGFDVNPNTNFNPAPSLNVTEDRTRLRLRARVGLEAKIADGVTGTIQLATGNDGSPVSTNQTFGAANSAQGQYGNFSKYNIWLDRAYLRLTPADWAKVDVGRMPNPFLSTDLLYDIDLNFDGLAAQFRHPINDNVAVFGTAGAFPYFNTDFNFGSGPGGFDKIGSRDRYLAAVQGGVDWKLSPQYRLQVAAAYYNFVGADGVTSSLCQNVDTATSCDTDQTRPFFTQNTNTFFPIRQSAFRTSPETDPNIQYFGLASRYRILDVNTRLDITRFQPYDILLEANWLQNVAFDRRRIENRGPVNNVAGSNFNFVGGDIGYLLRATFGHRDAETRRWAWNIQAAYRYLESDAVLDAFTDSDFRLGGTNAKGFILGGTLGVAANTALRARWLSGQEVSGAPFRADVVQVDLLSRF